MFGPGPDMSGLGLWNLDTEDGSSLGAGHV
jgi:hypothetical protein